MADPIKTLSDIINKNDRYDYNKIIYYTMTEDQSLIILDTDLFAQYMRFIAQYINKYKVSDYQRRYYRCKPKLLSQDIYGTPELYWLLIMINDQECPSKFHLKSTINLIAPDQLAEVYDTIITRSSDKLQENWNTYLPQVTTDVDDFDSFSN